MKNIIETMRKQGFSDEAIKHVFSRGNIIEGWKPVNKFQRYSAKLRCRIMRSASDFKTEIIRKLTAFYDYGDEYGYSNAELSRIRSCITKVEETPV